jgi:hypothetical protein
LINEVQGYCWDSKAAEKGIDAPIKRADHLLDALRYSVFSYFGEKVKLTAPTAEQLEGIGLGRLRSIERCWAESLCSRAVHV